MQRSILLHKRSQDIEDDFGMWTVDMLNRTRLRTHKSATQQMTILSNHCFIHFTVFSAWPDWYCLFMSSRPDPLHQWNERQHPPPGRHTAGAHSQQQLDSGFQSAHHHTPPHDVRQWGELNNTNYTFMREGLIRCAYHAQNKKTYQ